MLCFVKISKFVPCFIEIRGILLFKDVLKDLLINIINHSIKPSHKLELYLFISRIYFQSVKFQPNFHSPTKFRLARYQPKISAQPPNKLKKFG
jgi:hypothetical protein